MKLSMHSSIICFIWAFLWVDLRLLLREWCTTMICNSLRQLLGCRLDCYRLAVKYGFSLDRILEILAIVALAVAWAEDARLKAFTVLLEAGRFFARTTLCMLLLVRNNIICAHSLHLAARLVLSFFSWCGLFGSIGLTCCILLRWIDLRTESVLGFI